MKDYIEFYNILEYNQAFGFMLYVKSYFLSNTFMLSVINIVLLNRRRINV